MFMVLNYYGLSKKPKLFKNFTGFTVSEFDDIYKKLEENYDDYERERLDREDRRRAVGGGRKFKLPLRERFLILLVYYRLYITPLQASFLILIQAACGETSNIWNSL